MYHKYELYIIIIYCVIYNKYTRLYYYIEEVTKKPLAHCWYTVGYQYTFTLLCLVCTMAISSSSSCY